ncbi:hypothetical protein, partial [Pseudomonas sp. SWRI51]|uniref:hypothetical protein n=1 Tax=Pseudomonas sp. SWRI51 TaxID=2745491 RepID=UPI001EE38ED8
MKKPRQCELAGLFLCLQEWGVKGMEESMVCTSLFWPDISPRGERACPALGCAAALKTQGLLRSP